MPTWTRTLALAAAVSLGLAIGAPSPARAQAGELPGQPNNAAADLYEQGHRLVKKGRLEEAVTAFDAAAKKAPLFHLAHYAAGNVLAQLGRDREAGLRFEEAVAADPDFANGWNALGVIHLKSRRLERAIKAFDEALSAKEPLELARYHKGQALLRLSRLDEAEKELRRFLQKDPEHGDATVELAAARVRQGDPKGARGIIDTYLAKHPTHGRALLLRAQLLGAEGKLLDAARGLAKVLEAAGDDRTLRTQVGKYANEVAKLAKTGGLHAAQVRALEVVAVVVPKNANVYARLGAALIGWYTSAPVGARDERRRSRAVTALERSLEIAPDQRSVERLLQMYR